jgi:copper oxidase (laccase) domain-containing protein
MLYLCYTVRTMNNDEKILKALDDLRTDVQKQGERLEAVQADVHTLKDGQAHTNTVLKTLATKQDAEVAVDAAKSELKADILMLDSKVVKRIQSHERRITNIEEQEGIENPDKN